MKNRLFGSVGALFGLVVLSGFETPLAWSQPSTEIIRFNRCYALLTSRRLTPSSQTPNEPSSALLNQVRQGTLSGTQACMTVLDSAQLGTNNQVNQSNPDALRVLRRMQELHRQFFKVKNYINNLPVTDSTPNVIDLFEGANFLTFTLLKNGTPYSQVANGTSSYRAIRTTSSPPTQMLTEPFRALSLGQGNAEFPNHTVWNATIVPEGLLVGILPGVNNNTPSQLYSGSSHPYNFQNLFAGQNANAHKGAGILGTQAYLLSNIANYGLPNGTTFTHRRWAHNLMEDFLCRELPALRDSDVNQFVNQASPMSFRKATACNRCHATQDPLAGTVRNLIRASTMRYGPPNVHFVGTVASTQGTADIYPSNSDPNYYLRPAQGRLLYRSYNGALIDQPLTGLSDLGQKLAQGNDLYVCAAKKYYKFFTGVDVSLRDLGDQGVAQLTPGEAFHRTKVENLGLNLKNHQSLRTLFQEIISSPEFIKPYVVQ